MVDVNVSTEIKGVGQPMVSVVEMKDQAKPQVAPVAKGEDASKGNLDEQSRPGRKAQKLSQEDLQQMAQEIQERFDAMGTSLGFSIHEQTEDVVMEVTERETGELIRQIPSKEVLALREKLNELVGLLFDQEA